MPVPANLHTLKAKLQTKAYLPTATAISQGTQFVQEMPSVWFIQPASSKQWCTEQHMYCWVKSQEHDLDPP